jgi:hypothetical protein
MNKEDRDLLVKRIAEQRALLIKLENELEIAEVPFMKAIADEFPGIPKEHWITDAACSRISYSDEKNPETDVCFEYDADLRYYSLNVSREFVYDYDYSAKTSGEVLDVAIAGVAEHIEKVQEILHTLQKLRAAKAT